MRSLKSAAIAALLSALATSTSAQSFSDIFGRDLVSERGRITINANGTMGGIFDGQDFRGTWWIEDGTFCRRGSVGGTAFGASCQTIRMGNGRISFTNIDGGRTSTYRIE